MRKNVLNAKQLAVVARAVSLALRNFDAIDGDLIVARVTCASGRSAAENGVGMCVDTAAHDATTPVL